MRRSKQLLSNDIVVDVMSRCTNGILACIGDGDYPYAVPLSYVYFDGKIYFHSAIEGHKIDAVINNPKVSFAVVDEDIVDGANYDTYYRSVIAFGRARIVEGNERVHAFEALLGKYSSDLPVEFRHKKVSECTNAYIVAIDVEHITGKEALKFVKDRKDIV